LAAHRAQLLGERRVVSADQYQLRVREPPGNAAHRARAVAAEHHDAGGAIRIEIEPQHFGAPIDMDLTVEIRPNDHAGCRVDVLLLAAHGARLRKRARSAADQVLRLFGFDPKMRRKIGEIGHHGQIRNARQDLRQCLVHDPVEVGNQRNHDVRPGFAPMLAQLLGDGFMAEPDQRLQQLEFLRETQCPAACEPLIVIILRVHSRGLAKHALGVEHLEQVDEAHAPGPILFADHRLECGRRGPVAAAGVEINQIDRFQWLSIGARHFFVCALRLACGTFVTKR